MFTADHVWGLAVAADRINGGYVKADVYAENLDVVQKQANKTMVKGWLRNNQNPATAADVERGREVRNYFNGYLLKQIAGKINDFEQTALRIAQMDEFTNRNMLEFSVVSCLPSVMLRDQSRKELKNAISSSVQLEGEVGEKIQGEIEVFRCDYQQNYDKFIVQARMGDSYVSFWFSSRIDGAVTIRAKIKEQRGDNTTALNFVKIIG
jgi:acylphosphatase